MNRREALSALAGASILPSAAHAKLAQTISADAAPEGVFDIVAEFPEPGPSGIAVTPDGRIFVGFPRHAINHDKASLAELKDGELIPYPSAAINGLSGPPPEDRLVSIHGMTTDSQGRLWAIDDGKIPGEPITPGAAKVIGIDPTTNKVIAKILLTSLAMLPGSHMNDLRVDLTPGAQGTAYIADSSFGVAPALVVVDIATGRQRRVLSKHPSTQPEKGFMVVLEGQPLRYDTVHQTFPVGGVDGITLSADSSRLYYCPLTSRRLYSIPTAAISNFKASDDELAAEVRDEGEKGLCDGLATDPQDRIYITAGEHDAILRRHPDGRMDVVARDPRIIWPDGIFANDRYVYCVLGQWNRLPGFNGGVNLRRPPYLLIRVPTATAEVRRP
jgi:sugar lactone lactonase YvrE